MEVTKTRGSLSTTYCTVRNLLTNSTDCTLPEKNEQSRENKPTHPNFYERAEGRPSTKYHTDPQTLGRAKVCPIKGSVLPRPFKSRKRVTQQSQHLRETELQKRSLTGLLPVVYRSCPWKSPTMAYRMETSLMRKILAILGMAPRSQTWI